MPDRFKLFHAGGLGMQTRPPEVLERLVRDFFQVPAAVREFTGGWLRLPEALCCRLGVEADSSRLGRGAVAGTRILQRQQRFRLRLGPLKLADFRRFLPPRRWPPERGNGRLAPSSRRVSETTATNRRANTIAERVPDKGLMSDPRQIDGHTLRSLLAAQEAITADRPELPI